MLVLVFVIFFIIFLMTVTLHEMAHGYVAFLRGDDTAYRAGRLTLNPFKHIDLFWTILFPIGLLIATGGRFALGMAKPVPVNFFKLKRPRLDMVLVAVAGPAANFIFAWLLAAWYHATGFVPLLYGIYLNLGLACFNLIPIPPLDGSRILRAALPRQAAYQMDRIEPYGFMIVLVLYMSGLLFKIIVPAVDLFANLLNIQTMGI